MDNKKKLYLIMTIDTEDKYSSAPNMIECDFGDAGNCGVNYIMKQFEQRNMRGVFFVNIYEHNNFIGEYEGYMPKLLKRIDSRGHEVALHTHKEGCNLPFYKNELSACDYSQQYEIIEYGIEYINKCIGKYPVSHRGGAYRCNEITFKVLSDLGIKIDSSVYYSKAHNGNTFPFFYCLNQIHELDGVIEFPVINGFNREGVIKKFDPNSLSDNEIIEFIAQMKERQGYNCVQLMFHSFSFMDQKGNGDNEPYWVAGNHKAYGVSDPLTKRFETILDYIKNDPDIEVITFRDYLKMNMDIPSFWNDGLFYCNTDKSKNAIKEYKLTRYNPNCLTNNNSSTLMNYNIIFDHSSLNSHFSDNEVVMISEQILNGIITVYKRIEPLKIDFNEFDWNIQHSNLPETFQLYLQSLNFLQILVRAYELNKNVKYLKKAYDLIKSWKSYYSSHERISANKYVFYDHSVSLRSDNLIYFAKVCDTNAYWDKEMFDLIEKTLEENGNWLADEKNYIKSHNHGIMEDMALLHIGFCMQNSNWIQLAKERISEQKEAAFNKEFVHTENSPAYAQNVRKMFLKIADFLGANNDEFGKSLRDDMQKAQDYINWTIKPNGFIAQVGDSSNPIGVLHADASKLSRYSDKKHVVFPISGQYFFRSNSEELPQNDTWKFIKSGYTNTTHKHADDTSFMLYSKGYEIFTDSGIYGYKNDIYRKYFASALAHNSVIVDNQSYIADRKHMECFGMSAHSFFDEYDRVSVYNHAYNGVKINRDFCSNGDLTILYDYMESDDYHVYSQLFHLAENITVIEANDRNVCLKIGDSGYNVNIQQFGDPCRIQVIKGNLSIPQYGLISRAENHMDTITSLKFDTISANGMFVTAISVTDGNGFLLLNNDKKCKLEDLIYDDKRISFNISGVNMDSSFSNINLDNVVKETKTIQNGKQIDFNLKIHKPYLGKIEYAYYLYKDGEVIEKKMYGPNPEQSFNIKESGNYRIKYYLSYGELKKSYFGDTVKVK